jgi:hypothetical protein
MLPAFLTAAAFRGVIYERSLAGKRYAAAALPFGFTSAV